jgi:uncharacterized protein YndB with AHSA1/START domain
MTHGTLSEVDGRPALRFERRLAHPVERVWRALTDPAELAQWFVAPVPGWPAAGESFEAMGQPGRMVEVDASRVLGWTWGDERYRFELRPEGDGCLLVFTHVFDDRLGPAAQHAAGWEAYLDRLEALLAGGQLSEEAAHVSIAERHERYAQRFGQDPQPGRRAIAGMAFRDLTLDDGPVLRLQRRYPHSVQRVWRALTDPGELGRWFPSGEPLAITHAEPPRLLAATWYGDPVRFELRADGDGCVLTFTHAFADRDTSARTAAGWDRAFARIDALLAGAEMSEAASLDAWPAVHERYAQAFGVDPEIGRAAYAAHPLT